jgi:hypothetical protein
MAAIRSRAGSSDVTGAALLRGHRQIRYLSAEAVVKSSGASVVGDIGSWVLGGLTAILAVAALFVAAGADGAVGYYGGLGMFAFGVLFIFILMRAGFDESE